MEGPRLTWESTAASTAVLTAAALLYAWAVTLIWRAALKVAWVVLWAAGCAWIYIASRRESEL